MHIALQRQTCSLLAEEHRLMKNGEKKELIFKRFIEFFNLIFSPASEPLQLTGHLYFFIADLVVYSFPPESCGCALPDASIDYGG